MTTAKRPVRIAAPGAASREHILDPNSPIEGIFLWIIELASQITAAQLADVTAPKPNSTVHVAVIEGMPVKIEYYHTNDGMDQRVLWIDNRDGYGISEDTHRRILAVACREACGDRKRQ